jgi:uncharacterized membrane protein
MASGLQGLGAAAALAAALAAAPAQAELRLCNRMSYVAEAALAFDDHGAASARGWYRLDPGQCRIVVQGALPGGNLYLHARVPSLYGPAPLPRRDDAEFCVGQTDFTTAHARNCRPGQRPAPFAAVKPADGEQGPVVTLAEDATYDEDQARDAGIQRLLAVTGYDPGAIDGVRGEKTDNAIRQFTSDNKLTITAAGRSDFFTVLMQAAQKPGNGFTWCNDTPHAVMAAIGIDDGNTVTTRGWYRVEPGRCLRPDVGGTVKRVFSFGEAVDGNGQPLSNGGQPLTWGGTTALCTRPAKFEFYEHADCAARGLVQTGFSAVELGGGEANTVRFK